MTTGHTSIRPVRFTGPGRLMRAGVAWTAFVVMAWSSSLMATPLPKSQVSADAKWVLHLDMDQFAPSQTCRLLLNGQGEAKKFQGLLNHYQTLLGVDPLKDLSSMTLYGTETVGNRGVALINGSLNYRTITKQFSTYPQYRTKTSGKLTLQTWTDRATKRPLWASFHTSRRLIMASDERALLLAVATIDGLKPSLSSWKTAALPIPPPQSGTFFTASTLGYAGASPDPIQAMILKNTEHATMQVSENQGVVDGQVVLQASSPDAAAQIHQVLNGLMLTSSFADHASPFAKLAEASEISQNQKAVVLKLHCPAREAAGILAATMLGP